MVRQANRRKLEYAFHFRRRRGKPRRKTKASTDPISPAPRPERLLGWSTFAVEAGTDAVTVSVAVPEPVTVGDAGLMLH